MWFWGDGHRILVFDEGADYHNDFMRDWYQRYFASFSKQSKTKLFGSYKILPGKQQTTLASQVDNGMVRLNKVFFSHPLNKKVFQ